MPTVANLYRDPLLTNVSVKYTNSAFIADVVAPVIEVPTRTGYYGVYNKDNLRAPANDRRTGLAESPIVEYELTQTSYGPLTERSLKQFVTQDEIDHARASGGIFDPLQDAAENVTEKLLLRRELDLAADMANSSIVTQNTTLSGTGQWSDYTTPSDPLVAIQSYISIMQKAGAIVPNTLVMGQQVWDQLKNHPKVIDRLKYTTSSANAPDIFARLVGLERCIVGTSIYNSAAEGITDSLGYIWGKHAWLMYINPNPGVKRVSAFYHLTLQGRRGIDRWRDNDPPVQWVRVQDYYDRKLIAAEAVYGIFNAVA